MTDDRKDPAGRVQAAPPVPVAEASLAVPPADESPRAAAEAENARDEGSAGDGVTFFEGGDGGERARADIERDG